MVALFDELKSPPVKKMTDRFIVRRRSFKLYIIEIVQRNVKQT